MRCSRSSDFTDVSIVVLNNCVKESSINVLDLIQFLWRKKKSLLLTPALLGPVFCESVAAQETNNVL